MFIAGDPSGDQHTASIIKQLRSEMPEASLWGIGGTAMEKCGFAPVMPFAPFNRMGFVEVAAHIAFFLSAKKKLIDLMVKKKPDALVCVDYPGLNIPMMKAAHRAGIPVVWYIAPMVWAWKRRRAEILGSIASHIAVIFPFEVPFFSPYESPVTFVGNPLVEAMHRDGAFAHARKTHPGNRSANCGFRVALVPGSRRQEIEHLLPRMLTAFSILKQRHSGLRAMVSRSSTVPALMFRRIIGDAPVEVFEGPLREMLASADCALVTSGTATLETALMGVPLVVVYHTSFITYAIARHLVTIPRIGLPNIIAGEQIVPECIQRQADGANLAITMERFIESPELYNNTVNNCISLREQLGSKKPSMEVSRIIKDILECKQQKAKTA
jgi:lipid-A-disaccharide synthase